MSNRGACTRSRGQTEFNGKPLVYRKANQSALIYSIIAALLALAILIAIWLGAMRERELLQATGQMKEVQDALLRSQERYAVVESVITGAIWDWNLITNKVYISPRWRQILGFADDELRDVQAASICCIPTTSPWSSGRSMSISSTTNPTV